MAKAYLKRYEEFDHDQIWIMCPGCNQVHAVSPKVHHFNGDFNKPTFVPSLLCNFGGNSIKCHSFVREGMIQFLDDCEHDMRGKVVELPDIDETCDPERLVKLN